MKKILTLAMALLTVFGAYAQTKVLNRHDKSIRFVPKQFTSGDHVYFSVGKSSVSSPSSGSGTQTITVDFDIYNDDIKHVKTIKIDNTFVGQLIIGPSDDHPMSQFPLWDIVKENFNGWPYLAGFDDSNYRVNTASGDDWYLYWNPLDEILYEHKKEPDYYEWHATVSGPLSMELYDSDNGPWESNDFIFSQTLFNDDDKFEWLMCSEDASGNQQIDIMQEGGVVLQTIALTSTVSYPSNKYDPKVTILNGKTYLRIEDYDHTYFYLINNSSTTPSKSRALGDINNDGDVNTADVVKLVDIILDK